jgi:bifunctional UDP-N-acetylglucosamine pyrophosphorylase/glucosamine-1-phosphate N-acetyltransferase
MADEVKKEVTSDVVYRMQEEQLGTGHAVRCAKDFIGAEGDTIILCGDTPLITGETLKKLAEHHRACGNAVTVLTAMIDDPAGYGRIIRDSEGRFIKSVEHKDATEEERMSKEINSGMYIFNSKALSEALDLIGNSNAQGEYYLPDTLTIIKEKGLKADAMAIADASEIAGVNTPEQLAEAEAVMRKRGQEL